MTGPTRRGRTATGHRRRCWRRGSVVRDRLSRGSVAVALLVAVTAACSAADPDEAYCETVREEEKVVADLAGGSTDPGADVLTPALESLQRLQADAPDELGDEYSTVVNAYAGLVDAVEQAGLDPADLQGGRLPDDLDPAVRRRVRQTAATVAAPRVLEATLGIEDHALQVCGVDLKG